MISRKLSAIWSIVSLLLMAALVIGGMLDSQLPAILVAGAAAFFALLMGLTIVAGVRGASEQSRRHASFESNALGEPVSEHFVAPYHRALAAASQERTLMALAPVTQVAGSLKDLFRGGTTVVLGKAVVRDGENALLLTDRRLLGLMIGPEQICQYAHNPKVTRLLETLPGNASAKRRMLCRKGGAEVRETLEAMQAELDVPGLELAVFSFSIPWPDINQARVHLGKRMLDLRLRDGQHLRYALHRVPPDAASLDSLVNRLQALGVTLLREE